MFKPHTIEQGFSTFCSTTLTFGHLNIMVIKWKLLIVIMLNPGKCDHIKRLITITTKYCFSKWAFEIWLRRVGDIINFENIKRLSLYDRSHQNVLNSVWWVANLHKLRVENHFNWVFFLMRPIFVAPSW